MAEKTLSWRYPNAADFGPNSVRCRKQRARCIALTALGRCTIIEFCDGLMKTIIGIAFLASFGLVAAAQAARAQNTSPASSTPVAPKTADSSRNPASTSANPGEQGARGDVYYYFTMGHGDEQQYELTGRAELAMQGIEGYKKALELAPASPVIRERLAGIYANSPRLRRRLEQGPHKLER